MNKDLVYQIITAIAVAIGGYGTGRLQSPDHDAQQPSTISQQQLMVDFDHRLRKCEEMLKLPSPIPFNPGNAGSRDSVGAKE